MSKEARESRLRSRFESTFEDVDFNKYTIGEIRDALKARFKGTISIPEIDSDPPCYTDESEIYTTVGGNLHGVSHAYFGVQSAQDFWASAQAETDFPGFDGSLLDTVVVHKGQRRDIEEHYRKLEKIQRQFAEEKAKLETRVNAIIDESFDVWEKVSLQEYNDDNYSDTTDEGPLTDL